MELRVFAIDPGVTTGWAYAELDTEALESYGPDIERLIADDQLVFEASEEPALTGEFEGADPYKMDRHDLYWAERAAAARLWLRMDELEVDVLVIEDYTVYGGKASQVSAGGAVPLAPVRVGSMLALAAELAVVDVQYQMASLAKTTVSNERLKRWGLWVVGSEHARDAMRHLATYVRRLGSGEV